VLRKTEAAKERKRSDSFFEFRWKAHFEAIAISAFSTHLCWTQKLWLEVSFRLCGCRGVTSQQSSHCRPSAVNRWPDLSIGLPLHIRYAMLLLPSLRTTTCPVAHSHEYLVIFSSTADIPECWFCWWRKYWGASTIHSTRVKYLP